MSSKSGGSQLNMSNSLAIRQEIQRFESVHPSIYAIYDLIEGIADPIVQQQIRDHVVAIEDSFVNSQEWTLSKYVPELKLGIVGSVSSGKSSLVHRYLTGSYMQEESPEGGRFKKEVIVEGEGPPTGGAPSTTHANRQPPYAGGNISKHGGAGGDGQGPPKAGPGAPPHYRGPGAPLGAPLQKGKHNNNSTASTEVFDKLPASVI